MPELFAGGWDFSIGPPPATLDVLRQASSFYELPEACGFGTGPTAAAEFVNELFARYHSPWAVADAIECYCPDPENPKRLAAMRRIRDCCNDHAPHLSCVAGLLCDLHWGRDAELCAAIIRSVVSAA